MKRQIICAIISLFACFSLYAQTERMTINNGWEFRRSDSEKWEKVNIPHSWNEDAYHVKNYYQGKGFYKRLVSVPENWQGMRIYLKVDGANKQSVVYVNGKQVGCHSGGYSACTYDVTEYLAGGLNEVMIEVDNATMDVAPIQADFTFMGGIYRDVWLIAAPDQHFMLTNMGSDGIFLTPHDVSASKAGLRVSGDIVNDAVASSKLIVSSSLISPKGREVASVQTKLNLSAGASSSFTLEFPVISNPDLWSPDSPSLYSVETQILDAGTKRVLDERVLNTGFRWFELTADKGFFLNGKPLKLNGVCRHQDQAPFGYAISDDAHRRDMRMAKEMGVNFIRISHYPQDDAILDECDRLGILAWEEIPIVNIVPDNDRFADNSEMNLREMIRQHYNHASVITWGYMNEVMLLSKYTTKEGTKEREDLKKRTVALSERLAAVVREEDPTRAVCMAFQEDLSYIQMNMQKDLDILGWNLYSGWYGDRFSDFDRYMDARHKDTPEHLLIVSEYGAGADTRIHSLNPERFDFSSEYQQLYIEHYLKVIAETPYIAGGAYWNLIDFSSASREESMPRINNKGILKNDRTPKDVFYLFQAAWRNDVPVLHIASRDWSHRTGYSTDAQPFKVYSNLDELELFINGESLGTKAVEDWKAEWKAGLKPGKNMVECRGSYGSVPVSDVVYVEYHELDDVLKADRIDFAVNVGSNTEYHDPYSDVVWVPDQPYSQESGWGYAGGTRNIATGEIGLTSDDPLYQTWHEGIESYRFDVPAGEYELELLFADHSKQNASVIYMLAGNDAKQSVSSTMDVMVNGHLIEKSFSPSFESGNLTAVRRRHVVTVNEGGMIITFESEGGPSFLNGIKIRSL